MTPDGASGFTKGLSITVCLPHYVGNVDGVALQ